MDYTLVTVMNKKNGWSVDMELPAKLKIRELIPKLLDALKQYDERQFGELQTIGLATNGKRIQESASLADYDLWDGSIIELLI